VTRDAEDILLNVETTSTRLTLNLRRGLTVHSLGFASQGFTPVVGTIPHGFFSTIALGADFYTGGVVVEIPGEKLRITDLEWVQPSFERVDGGLRIGAEIDTSHGSIVKTIAVDAEAESVTIGYSFSGWERPLGTIRVGTVTLMPGAFQSPIRIECANGGPGREVFAVDDQFDHTRATSRLISSTAGLGATDGSIVIGDGERRIEASWDPGDGAVLPMLSHEPAHPAALTRLFFSLLEMDDTAQVGGPVGSFSLTIRSSR
jgi:hypothetical protein